MPGIEWGREGISSDEAPTAIQRFFYFTLDRILLTHEQLANVLLFGKKDSATMSLLCFVIGSEINKIQTNNSECDRKKIEKQKKKLRNRKKGKIKR